MQAELITSKDNPLLQRIRKLGADASAYRKLGVVWLEGDHLVAAALARGLCLDELVFTESAWAERVDWRGWVPQARRVVQVPEVLFRGLSGLESPARIGALMSVPVVPDILPDVFTVVLDRLQDAGNVGSILRSAAAFGVKQVLAIKGTAGLWSPKVLRAGMGAHFALRLVEGLAPEALAALRVPLLATSSHGGLVLGRAALPFPCGWVLGHEGQGVDAALMARCAHRVQIPQPGGEESLNVAAAAAICLFCSGVTAASRYASPMDQDLGTGTAPHEGSPLDRWEP
jgi:TrmH family RNA methyltransferase